LKVAVNAMRAKRVALARIAKGSECAIWARNSSVCSQPRIVGVAGLFCVASSFIFVFFGLGEKFFDHFHSLEGAVRDPDLVTELSQKPDRIELLRTELAARDLHLHEQMNPTRQPDRVIRMADPDSGGFVAARINRPELALAQFDIEPVIEDFL